MILNGAPLADRLAPVKVDADGVEQGQNSDGSKGKGGNEGTARGLVAKVEHRDGYGADVNGIFELNQLANRK